MRRRGELMPHAKYGVTKMPDTYVEPFVAYRAWNWTAEGIMSLNHAPWTPKVAFEATCHYRNDWKSMVAAAPTEEARRYWQSKEHHCPDVNCSCGMYAGINMKHLIDTKYIERGIHGEVSLWGRLYRHTLGWRAQFAYPKYFVVPTNMVPFDMTEAQRRLAQLTDFGVDIHLQTESDARVGQQTIPLWVNNYGYSQQGLSFLVEKRKAWYEGTEKKHMLAVGDRVAVLGDGGGIGIVKKIGGDDVYYTLFSPTVIYRKRVKDIVWNERNWRWETSGLGSMRKLAMGGDRCLS